MGTWVPRVFRVTLSVVAPLLLLVSFARGAIPYLSSNIAIAPNGFAYVIGALTGGIAVIDTGTGSVVRTIPPPSGSSLSGLIAIAPNGTAYVAANGSAPSDDGILVTDTTKNVPTGFIPLGAPIRSLAVSPDGNRLFATTTGLTVIDTLTDSVLATVPVGAGPAAVRGNALGSPSPISTLTTTPAGTATPTPTTVPCIGDCDDNGVVTVDEILTMINIALGNTPVRDCLGNVSGDGDITIDEILAAVNNALNGCPLTPERGCLTSGGTVTTATYCASTGDFPNTCAIGACGCPPDASHEARVCTCASGCFNGSRCVGE